MRRTIGSARGDARGEAPCMKITLISPFPPGRGAGGWGKEIKPKARLAGDQPGKPPFGHLQRRFSPCRFRLGRGDARGEAPCMKITLISPFPGGEERSASAGGGMGKRKQAKGKVGRRPTGQATLWAPPTPPDPATCRASHPLGTANTRRPRRPAGQATPWAPPTPAAPATCRTSHPSGTTAAGIAGKQKGAPRGTQVPRGAPRAKKPGNLLNYLLSFLITRLS